VSLGEIRVDATGEHAATIHLSGEFDLSNVRKVEAVAYEHVGAGVRELCLDLHDVSFMDSSMLNLLVNLRKRLAQRGGSFRIQPNLEVEKLLEITGLGGLFELVEDPDEQGGS
jgi:anti-sigma B factor antagonist